MRGGKQATTDQKLHPEGESEDIEQLGSETCGYLFVDVREQHSRLQLVAGFKRAQYRLRDTQERERERERVGW